jgi:hypothetical protein
MQGIEEALAGALQDDADRILITSIAGSADPGTIADSVSEFVRRVLKADVAACHRLEVSVGIAMGLTLADGRQVMAKLHGSGMTLAGLRAVSEVQEFLHSAGFPCPQVLCRPAALGSGCITVEDFVARGRHADAHVPRVRRAMAEALAEQIVRSSRFIDLGDLPRRKPSTLDGLWPEPHNALFDFRKTAEGAAWIDRIARRSYAQLDTVPHPPVVGHSDWTDKHFRFKGSAVAIIYDWDSLLLNDEYRTVGGAAATFPCNWYLDVPKVPTPEESVLFVQEYEGARGRRFSREEHRWICAAGTYCMAYGARCEHAIDPAGRNMAGSFREALGSAGTGNYFEQ